MEPVLAMDLWAQWWVWIALAIGLVIFEILAPGFVFLGFAVGAGVVGILLALGLSVGLPVLLVIGASLSVVAWLLMRKISGVRRGQAKTFDRDINEM